MKVSKKIVVILNGQMPKNENLIKQIKSSDYIIAVDGSGNTLIDLNIIPDVIIGDFDSINSLNDEAIEFVETKDQSKTDFRKTLEWCIDKNILEISIFGISGKSDDHFLGNYYTLNDFGSTIQWRAFTDFSIISPCKGMKKFESFKGQKVSLFCMKGSSIISSKNLEYPLKSYQLKPSDEAVRNIAIADQFTIESTNTIFVFQSRQ
jgi:thiamine pyrophosphokinase